MTPTRPYVCVCLKRGFDSQKGLTVHENVCPVVADHERRHYHPYRKRHQKQQPRQRAEAPPINSLTERLQARLIQSSASTNDNPGIHTRPDDATSNPIAITHPTIHSPLTTRSRTRNMLSTYRDTFDVLPEAPPAPLEPLAPCQTTARTRTRFTPFETPPDSFGRFCVYTSKPITIPDCDATLEDFTNQDHSLDLSAVSDIPSSLKDAIWPCPNLSTFYLLRWFWKQSNNSLDNRQELLEKVLLQPDFNPADLLGLDLRAIDKKLAAVSNFDGDQSYQRNQGWRAKSVPIQLPLSHQGSTRSLAASHRIMVPGGIRKSFRQNNQRHFQYEPFKLLWTPPGKPRSEAQELMGEIYNSPAMIEAHKDIQKLKISDESCTLPRVVAAVMFGSDAMQLGPFGTKKAWMLYMWLGNLSKYERCKPNSGSCYELAHIPSLPDSVKDEITKLNGRPPSASLLTHLRRELMHAVMQELLDADFVQAWQHGIVIDCADGIRRRVFPRIFTYSADYPERVLLATIRDKGYCPCPRCLVPLELAHKMGSRSDMQMRKRNPRRDNLSRQKLVQRARDIIYKEHRAVDNAEVQRLLQSQSLVPTEMFVVDLLHEIELGVWKSLLTHLIRIIHGCGSDVVAEFNRRFRQVPTFTGSTIRRFNEDVASLKRLAGRDLEDLLQCCMPVFKGLLPTSIDSQVQQLLFTLAFWHGLAKLRQQTTATLKKLATVTTQLGNDLRDFQEATNNMEVFETPREFNARQRQAAARAQHRRTSAETQAQTTRKLCRLNLDTPKFHMVGHYVSVIAQFGTTDSFSTQTTELQHRKIKAQWFRTNMRDAVFQMTQIGDIGDALETIQRRIDRFKQANNLIITQPASHEHDSGDQPYGIGQSDRTEDAVSIPVWVQEHRQEPRQVFYTLLETAPA
ncbi:colossin-A [Ceratobasidium sp. AG-Ba]|nr:colossin-A [Ceratobasidium sp. AG-Ba]